MFSFAEVNQVCKDILNMATEQPRETSVDFEKTVNRVDDNHNGQSHISSSSVAAEKLGHKSISSQNKENEPTQESLTKLSGDAARDTTVTSACDDDEKSKQSSKDGNSKLPPDISPSDASSPGTEQVSSTQTSSKICVVCNDKALSCNFGAITCESCKAFFRRNAHKVCVKGCTCTFVFVI